VAGVKHLVHSWQRAQVIHQVVECCAAAGREYTVSILGGWQLAAVEIGV
jgi:hypothetical protein